MTESHVVADQPNTSVCVQLAKAHAETSSEEVVVKFEFERTRAGVAESGRVKSIFLAETLRVRLTSMNAV
jgi:aconitase B